MAELQKRKGERCRGKRERERENDLVLASNSPYIFLSETYTPGKICKGKEDEPMGNFRK